MTRHINLSNIKAGKAYHISGFEDSSSDYAEKLYKMGFVEGTPVELAPVNLTDPMVIEIRGSRIALRKKEAEEVLVEAV